MEHVAQEERGLTRKKKGAAARVGGGGEGEVGGRRKGVREREG